MSQHGLRSCTNSILAHGNLLLKYLVLDKSCHGGECYFDWKFKCNDSLRSKGFINIKAKQIQNIIRCCQLYQDNIHEKLQPQFDSNLGLILQAHKVCIEKYLHPKEVQKAVKHHTGDADVSIPAPKRTKRSEVPKFNFQQHCNCCGEECLV